MEERDFSSIKLLEKVIQLVLPMRFISDEFAGVLETLESWKRQYNPQLDGILVSYSNVSLMSRSNKVIISKSGIIIDVKAVFHLFCPKVGDVVKGKVNRISRELVGCIMHDTINATIYFTDYYPDELKKFIRIEREILFAITFFSCYRNEVRVQGKITPDCLKMMTELFPEVEEEDTDLSFQSELTHYDFLNDVEELPVFKPDIDIPLVNIDNLSEKAAHNDVALKKTNKRKLDASPDGKPSKKKRKRSNTLSESNNINGDFTTHDDELVCKKELESNEESNAECFSPTLNEPEEQIQPNYDHLKKKKKQKKDKHEKKPKKKSNVESVLKKELKFNDESNLEYHLQNLKELKDDHSKKNRKRTKEKNEKSKKRKIVATGTVVKSDKKKLKKEKHLKKNRSKKKDKKSKKGHKKEKKRKHSNGLLNSDIPIKPEI